MPLVHNARRQTDVHEYHGFAISILSFFIANDRTELKQLPEKKLATDILNHRVLCQPIYVNFFGFKPIFAPSISFNLV